MKYLFTLLVAIIISSVSAQEYQPTKNNLQNRVQFQDNKFGLFIHWGLFSVLGDGEWVMQNKNIKTHDYQKLQQFFNPIDFRAAEWVKLAKDAGMKYITFITRHHDGFSNWDTKQSDWKITNTPYKKDVLKELAEECKKQNMPLFLYYSLLDWYRTDYPYETGNTGKGTGRTAKSDFSAYHTFMKAQLKELLTNYGTIAGIWFDGEWDQEGKNHISRIDWRMKDIYDHIHSLQPDCLIGNNHHVAVRPGEDFQMFEKDLPGFNSAGFNKASVSALPLETCETMNNAWGFKIDDNQYKSVKSLIHYLVKAAGANANFLLNVGPMPNGQIQSEFVDTLKKIGAWMQTYGSTIYGTRGNLFAGQEWGVVTQKANMLYVHVLKKPSTDYIFIPGLKAKIKQAIVFGTKQVSTVKQIEEGSFIYLTGILNNDIDTIIQIELNEQ